MWAARDRVGGFLASCSHKTSVVQRLFRFAFGIPLRPLRRDVVAASSRTENEVADPSISGVTQNGAPKKNGAISHAACCRRFGVERITGLCTECRRNDS